MDDPLLREQTPAEYFKELVESALSRQHLQAAELTEYYLVNLLCEFIRPEACATRRDDGEALALRLARGLDVMSQRRKCQKRTRTENSERLP